MASSPEQNRGGNTGGAAWERGEGASEERVGSGRARGDRLSRLGGRPGAETAGGGQTGGASNEGRCPCFGQRRKKRKQWVDLVVNRKSLGVFYKHKISHCFRAQMKKCST